MFKNMKEEEKLKPGTRENPFCGNRKCQDFECVRHRNYIPLNELIWRENYMPDKNGLCTNKII